MNKLLEKWNMLDLQQFLMKNDIEIIEAIVLIGARATEMYSRASNEGMEDLADHHRKIMFNCLKILF